MSATTRTEYLDEDVPKDATATPVVPETGQDQGERRHDHEHTHEDGEVSPMCSGGGCVTKTSTS